MFNRIMLPQNIESSRSSMIQKAILGKKGKDAAKCYSNSIWLKDITSPRIWIRSF